MGLLGQENKNRKGLWVKEFQQLKDKLDKIALLLNDKAKNTNVKSSKFSF